MQWRCPICKKPTDSNVDKDFPFCSERCRLTDLGNWASEKYKVSRWAAVFTHCPEKNKNTRKDNYAGISRPDVTRVQPA